jgi:hypothetical protein
MSYSDTAVLTGQYLVARGVVQALGYPADFAGGTTTTMHRALGISVFGERSDFMARETARHTARINIVCQEAA